MVDEGQLKLMAEKFKIDCVQNNINEVRVNVEAFSAERRGCIVYYRVHIGQFELTLMMLNLPRRGMTSGRRQIYKGSKSEVF